MIYDFAIVGGGVAGASLAYFLKKDGASVCLLESNKRLGGVIASQMIKGFLCESAAQSLQSNLAVQELINDFALSAITPESEFSKKFIEKNGKLFLAPSGILSFFSTNLLSFSAKVRVLQEAFVAKGNLADESVNSFISRRFGAEFAEKLFVPLVHGIWAGDASKLSMRSSFPKLWEMEKRFNSLIRASIAGSEKREILSFKNGMQTLLDAIAKELGADRIFLNSKITNLVLVDSAVELGRKIKARQVILATTASASANLIRPFDSGLADEISKVTYSPLGLIHLAIPVNRSYGAGFLSVGGRATIGVLCSSNAFADRAPEGEMLLTCFIGGAKNPELADVREQKIEAMIIKEISETFKLQIPPRVINKVFRQNAIPNYELGHFKLQEMAQSFNHNSKAVKLFGSWLNGAGIGSIIENARQFSKCLN